MPLAPNTEEKKYICMSKILSSAARLVPGCNYAASRNKDLKLLTPEETGIRADVHADGG